MRKWLILLFALGVSSVQGAPAWTWVDANGQVHFSDTPVPGAKRVELASAQSFGRAQAQPQAQQSPAANEPGEPAGLANQYRTFNITSPTQQETLWNTGSVVNVQVALEPALRPNHRLDLFLEDLVEPICSADRHDSPACHWMPARLSVLQPVCN